ncbi:MULTISPECIES: hypothetical protein [Nocardioides]|uniref:Carboxypeptidase regulatory-like domain-containing protein n=1 Tax=Nocardioides vastitatis TaxID=2568655 RepID=A0ABW0ZFT9_9ACTN|nr:hypothetical protein [Nocardioides sp.]THJ16110.1 hypothetical protein E7Z54_00125 [Nocardioides sp.]
MSSWDELTDDELMAELAEAVAEQTTVTDARREAARTAFTWRTVDEELAELLHDSALDAGAAVRSSADGPRSLSFGRSGLTLEVEVEGDQVLGQVIGEGAASGTEIPATVTLRRPGVEDTQVEADRSGFFRFSGVGPGPARFVVKQAAWSLTTPWVSL